MNRKTMRFVFGIMFSVSGRITFLLLRFLKSLFPLMIFRTKDPIRVPINMIMVGVQYNRKIASSCLSWILFYSKVTTLVVFQIKSFDFPRFRSSLETKSFFSSYPLSWKGVEENQSPLFYLSPFFKVSDCCMLGSSVWRVWRGIAILPSGPLKLHHNTKAEKRPRLSSYFIGPRLPAMKKHSVRIRVLRPHPTTGKSAEKKSSKSARENDRYVW